MRTNCRIVKNLVYDFVLGWDFFHRYDARLNAKDGYLSFEGDERINLIPNTTAVSSTHFAFDDDVYIPAFSKMHTQATFFINPEDRVSTSDTVMVEPLYGNISQVAVARSVSRVNDGRFMTEIMNPHPNPVTITAGTVLGHVHFVTDAELEHMTEKTDVLLAYGGDGSDSGYESEDCALEEEIEVDPPPLSEKPATPCSPKPKIDYSKLPEDAKAHQEQLRTLLEDKHAGVFSADDRDRGKTDLVQHYARIKPGPPIAVPPYRTTPQLQKVIDDEVFKMLADGLVSHSTSSYSAPVLLAKKKDGGWRFCTDFRKVNERCERHVYPLPRIEDSLQKLKEPRFFSTMDLQKGFWQIPIAEEDRKYFAFSTGSVHVEYNVMPMGALNSSSTMQALMTLILRGLPPEHIIGFLDDILVASNTMEEHL